MYFFSVKAKPAENREPADEPLYVRVAETHVGKGVFATRPIPATAIVGRITGEMQHGSEGGGEYTFDFEDGMQLEPDAPFRFVNHSCDPNCEFHILEEPGPFGQPGERHLYLCALRNIEPNEELTIAYNWPASCAIECHCNSPNCVGRIVCETELDQVQYLYDDEYEQCDEFGVPSPENEQEEYSDDQELPTPASQIWEP